MATIAGSFLNLRKISSRFFSFSSSLDKSKKTTVDMKKVLLNKTRVTKEAIQGDKKSFARKKEYFQRKAKEDVIEAREVIFRPINAITKGAKGFLSRILDFLGSLLLGWLTYNLPTIITMATELIARIQRMVTIFKSFMGNVLDTFTGFGKVLGAVFQNVISFDFFDTSNRVKGSLSELGNNFEEMQFQFDEGMKLMTTPLSEGLVTGQDAAPPGTDYTISPGDETSAGGRVSPQAVYSYLKSKGVSHIHAMGILANIEGESGFQMGVPERGDSQSGVGLFQYSNVRKPAFLRAVPNYKTNWKGQIDYAINEDRAPQYLKMQFSSPEEAAYWWMDKWERPAARVYSGRNQKHNAFIKSFKPGDPSQSQAQSQPQPQTRIEQVPAGKINPIVGDRLGAGRNHGGTDLAVPNGTPLRAVSDGVIVDSDFQRGWGNFLVFKDNQGIYHLYGHMQSGYKRSGPVKKGEIIGKVGMTGRTTGPHLHWEAGTGWTGGVISGRFDPLNKYSKFAPFNTQPGPGVSQQPSQAQVTPQTTPAQVTPQATPAQISSSAQSRTTAQEISTTKPGQQVVIVDDRKPPQMIPVGGGGGGGQPQVIVVGQTLNSFIKNKLLLDLVYT